MPHINIRNSAGKIVGSLNDEAGTTEISEEWKKQNSTPETTAEESALEETPTDDGNSDTADTA